MTTLPHLLATRAAAEPERLALIVDGVGSLTIGDWETRSDAVAHAVLRRGLRLGDRVGLLFGSRNWIDYAICFLGVQKAGGVAVPLPPRAPAAELTRLLTDCAASGLLHEDASQPAPFDGWSASVSELEEAAAGDDQGPVDIEVRPGDLAQILYTSGTTGRPKGVAATHANLTHGCGGRRRPFAHSRHLAHAFPIGTNAGQVMLVNALDARLAVLSPARFTPARFARMIQEYAAGTVFLVPAMAVELLAGGSLEKYDLSSVVLLGSAAAPLPGAVAGKLVKAFPNATIANYYTSTEAAPAQTVMLYDPTRPGSVGRALAGGAVRIAASGSGAPVEAGQIAPVDEVGEVWLRSPTVSRTYYGDAESSREVFHSGWIRMGDLGYVDADGYLYLVDRDGDLVKSGAFKVSTLRVEEALYEHPDVLEAAVVGLPHPSLGKALAAVVVPREPVPAEQLREFLLERLAPHEVPSVIVEAEALPRNAGGKVDKRALLKESTWPT
ncbi:AMP-dependent synthetase and ligase [Catenulispora acidiphila DSM 44928]|uniref:AMP-dependent synthetase and ligase n=1 Tax=Catenulispora acidiphila (strain DSM 44928 / JCM 14897 / NBRC 102108 / NRRL B-24433 / ID139908) TaxID=479433 RepID=C7Q4Y3_CATAD|nr:class I adenylate-forming enzyme family protein [Catenulispora acidiphila]ACU73931.1 AMP-dependent synthetase and ligase [Catenulispora acidiphila DSM 44928]